MHTGPGGSLSATLADLETIWSHVIQKQLDIPLKDLKVRGGTHLLLICAFCKETKKEIFLLSVLHFPCLPVLQVHLVGP